MGKALVVEEGARTKESPKILYEQVMSTLKPEISKAYVNGKYCEYTNHFSTPCRGADANCLQSKAANCILARKYGRVEKAIEYLKDKVEEIKQEGKDVSQLVYYIKLAEERLDKGKFPNVRVYLRIIRKKLKGRGK